MLRCLHRSRADHAQRIDVRDDADERAELVDHRDRADPVIRERSGDVGERAIERDGDRRLRHHVLDAQLTEAVVLASGERDRIADPRPDISLRQHPDDGARAVDDRRCLIR